MKQETKHTWSVNKIAVIGSGIVGVPMAALLAEADIRLGTYQPADVLLIQTASLTSGWKVEAVNTGKSPIQGIEPDLEAIISRAVQKGTLKASHDYKDLHDADIILICVQTDKKGYAPDYGPLKDAVTSLAEVLAKNPPGRIPLLVFESTLAPTTMTTWIKDHFESFGLKDGRDIYLGNSPNRVMPGRLVERIRSSDKIIGSLHSRASQMIRSVYSHVVTRGTLHLTNSLTAEIIKTFENAHRDVRIAYSAEIARYCDDRDIDFYQVRNAVNSRLAWSDHASADPSVVPSGGLLIPTIGVGGHCLPKDGILMLWRQIESNNGAPESLFLEARVINEESPVEAISRMEKSFGPLAGKMVALLGVAYRADSEDARNSPTLALGRILQDRGCRVALHDPFVKPDDSNLLQSGLTPYFSQDLDSALESAEILVFCASHKVYKEDPEHFFGNKPWMDQIYDGCHIFPDLDFAGSPLHIPGIGKGKLKPSSEFVDFVHQGFLAMQQGVANEVRSFICFVNERFARTTFEKVNYMEVQKLAGTCATGCFLVDPSPVKQLPEYKGFSSRLAERAYQFYRRNK